MKKEDEEKTPTDVSRVQGDTDYSFQGYEWWVSPARSASKILVRFFLRSQDDGKGMADLFLLCGDCVLGDADLPARIWFDGLVSALMIAVGLWVVLW